MREKRAKMESLISNAFLCLMVQFRSSSLHGFTFGGALKRAVFFSQDRKEYNVAEEINLAIEVTVKLH